MSLVLCEKSTMTKNPCYFTMISENETEIIAAVCLQCVSEKNIKGMYWDKDFNEKDNKINCHFCKKTIFLRNEEECLKQ